MPRLVASFACFCGCQDEVLEPAPQTVKCWGCKADMHRWTPKHEPPAMSARETTDEEKRNLDPAAQPTLL